MRIIDEIKEIIEKLERAMWDVVYGKDISYSSLKLIFLKYAVDNYIGAVTADEMRSYANAQKMFASKDIVNGDTAIIPVLEIIDSHYDLKGILRRSDLLDEYASILMGVNSKRQRVGADETRYKAVMEYLGSLNLEEEPGTHSLGQAIVEYYMNKISMNTDKSTYTAMYTTGKEISQVAKGLLNVEIDDKFCDFMSGMGVSTINICKDTMPSVECMDINVDAVALSAIIFILYGYERFSVNCADTLRNPIDLKDANKIFVDAPLSYKVESIEDPSRRVDAASICMSMVDKQLSLIEGIGVITIPGSALFSSKGEFANARRELLANKRVKAVISLPQLWRGTSIFTNLLVLSSEKNEKIMIVDASASGNKASTKQPFLMSDEEIEKVVNTVNSCEEIPGYSKLISLEEIQEKDFNLSPSSFIEKIIDKPMRSIADIDGELKKLYELLNS